MLRLQPGNSPNPLLLPSVYTSSVVQVLLHNANAWVQSHIDIYIYEILNQKTERGIINWECHCLYSRSKDCFWGFFSLWNVSRYSQVLLAPPPFFPPVMSLSLCLSCQCRRKNNHIWSLMSLNKRFCPPPTPPTEQKLKHSPFWR